MWYNYGTPPWETNKLIIFERKWFIDRFVEQKNKEADAQEKAMNKK